MGDSRCSIADHTFILLSDIHLYTGFIVKAPVSIFIYLIAILVVAGISLGTLFWQVNKATRINPATIMKAE